MRNLHFILAPAALLSTTAMAQMQNDLTTPPTGKYPPWQDGRNNDVAERGLNFTVPEVDNLADFHGNPNDPLLSLYVGGNYFFAMAPLIEAFERTYPQYKGRIYWETIPPGLLVRQMEAGGTITVGNMTWTVKPDVFLAGRGGVEKQLRAGLLAGPVVSYVTNKLAIMVPKGNPAAVRGLNDLARSEIRLAMPNPEFEGVAKQIRDSLVKAGGEKLADTVYKAKVANGSALLTQIHHRQTPLWLMQGKVDAGVTWASEVEFQKQAGHPIEGVEIPDALNSIGTYSGALAKNAPHKQAGRRWLQFIRSAVAVAIFERYGFRAYAQGSH